MNLSSNNFWADINFGKEIGSLSNNINYNYENIILFIVGSWLKRGREIDIFVKFATYLIFIEIFRHWFSVIKI